MKHFVKSDPLNVGCVSQKDLIDKHFQQFLLINQIMFNWQRKRERSGKLSQSGLWIILLWPGIFHTDIKKDVMTSLFVFILSSETWMYFPEKIIFELFWLGLCFHTKYRRWPWTGYSTASCSSKDPLQQDQPHFQTKTASWFYFWNNLTAR